MEGMARDFIREFLPAQFQVKSGLVFDTHAGTVSPQVDAIIYSGPALLEYTDAAIAEKAQVKALVEVKTYTHTPGIFGEQDGGTRDPSTGLAYAYDQRKSFLPPRAKYILFTFGLYSGHSDTEVVERLTEISDMYAVVYREESPAERRARKDPHVFNFDHSVSRLIEWLRNLK